MTNSSLMVQAAGFICEVKQIPSGTLRAVAYGGNLLGASLSPWEKTAQLQQNPKSQIQNCMMPVFPTICGTGIDAEANSANIVKI